MRYWQSVRRSLRLLKMFVSDAVARCLEWLQKIGDAIDAAIRARSGVRHDHHTTNQGQPFG